MLYHHGSLPYEVALAECAQHTRESYQKVLDQGQRQLPAAIDALQTVPDDTLVKSGLLDIVIDTTNHMTLKAQENDWKLHDNAWSQICAKTGFPEQFGNKLRNLDWGRELVALNLNTIFENADPDKRYLIRSVKGEARGFLSDRYRRLDMRPIADEIFGLAQQAGAVVLAATATDLKVEIKFAYPAILEPIKDEPIMYWVGIRSSDFSLSKWEIFTGLNRAWCTNMARVDTLMSQVHLGKQLPEDIEFSQETYRKDTAYVMSASRDIFKDALSERRVGILCEKMKLAASQDAPKDIPGALKRAGLTKQEVEEGSLIYAIPEIQVLPKENTMWRFSNVISFLAGQSAVPDRKLELETIAGNVISQMVPHAELLNQIISAA
jgi:hypothetical protein